MTGSCPNLAFAVTGTAVYADQSTQFREGNCKHIEEGQRVIVVGERQADSRIRAERIDLKPRD